MQGVIEGYQERPPSILFFFLNFFFPTDRQKKGMKSPARTQNLINQKSGKKKKKKKKRKKKEKKRKRRPYKRW